MHRILIVDDEELIREMLKDELRLDQNFQVFEANGGLSAMKILAENPIELMITDLIMPNQGGIETILEAKKFHPKLKIFAISGSEVNLRKAKTFGVDEIFEKPLDALFVIDQVKEFLAK